MNVSQSITPSHSPVVEQNNDGEQDEVTFTSTFKYLARDISQILLLLRDFVCTKSLIKLLIFSEKMHHIILQFFLASENKLFIENMTRF